MSASSSKDILEDLHENYFLWLVHEAGGDGFGVEDTCTDGTNLYGRTYYILLKRLYEIEYYWTIPGDKNRAADGIDLRADWADEMGLEAVPFGGGCTVLEMLLGLAKRCDDAIMYDAKYGVRTKKWFWMFIENLGLIGCHDKDFPTDGLDLVSYVIQEWLDRKVQNGENEENQKCNILKFSILKTPKSRLFVTKKFWAKMELWDQLGCAINFGEFLG